MLRLKIFTSACAGYPNENENWIHNEAHGGLFGVYLNKDWLPGCSHIRGFFIWRSFDHAIYFQVSMLNFFHFLTLDLKFQPAVIQTAGEGIENYFINLPDVLHDEIICLFAHGRKELKFILFLKYVTCKNSCLLGMFL